MTTKYFKFALYIVAVILVNAAGITFFARVDLTGNRIYSISEASVKAVSNLSEPLTIDVFFTRNLPAPYNSVGKYLRDLLEEYAVHADRRFNYKFYDVSPDQGDVSPEATRNRKLASDYGIRPVQVQKIEKDEVKFQKAYMGMVLIHGDAVEKIPAITSADRLEYKLTTAIRKLHNRTSALLALRDDIRVKLYLSSSLEAVGPYIGLKNLDALPGKVKEAVNELNKHNYGKLKFSHIDPTNDKREDPVLAKHNIAKLKWPDLPEGGPPAGSGVIGIVMESGERSAEIPVLNVVRIPLFGTRYDLVEISKIKEAITDGVETLVDINDDLEYLVGHGSVPLASASPSTFQSSGPISNLRSLVSRSYNIKPVKLGGESIGKSARALVVAGPKNKFTDYELFQIDQALMRGQNLIIFLDPYEEKAPPGQGAQYGQPPVYTPVNTGLEKLLEHYGVRVKKSYVLDKSCFKQRISPRFGGGSRDIFFAPFIKNRFINHDLGFMKNVKGMVTLKIAPLETDEAKLAKNGIKSYRLFSSSDKSWETGGRIDLNPNSIRPPEDSSKMKSFALAYLLEGEFPSYFAGKPIPVRKVEGEDSKSSSKNPDTAGTMPPQKDPDVSPIKMEGGALAKSKPARIFVMGSSEAIKDNMVDPEGKTPNSLFILNVIDTLSGHEDIATMRNKEHTFNPLNETPSSSKTAIKTFNIAGLPALVSLFGIGVWIFRLRRKRLIAMMFDKA